MNVFIVGAHRCEKGVRWGVLCKLDKGSEQGQRACWLTQYGRGPTAAPCPHTSRFQAQMQEEMQPMRPAIDHHPYAGLWQMCGRANGAQCHHRPAGGCVSERRLPPYKLQRAGSPTDPITTMVIVVLW